MIRRHQRYSWEDIGPLIPDFCWQTAQEIFSMFDEVYPDAEYGNFASLICLWRTKKWLLVSERRQDVGKRGKSIIMTYRKSPDAPFMHQIGSLRGLYGGKSQRYDAFRSRSTARVS